MAERLNCKSTEAVIASFGEYVSIRGGGIGILLTDGQEVHFQGDKRDAVNRGGKLVWLDGPLGGAGGADPRIAEIKAALQAIIAKL